MIALWILLGLGVVAIILGIYRRFRSIDVAEMQTLHW